MYHHLVIDQSTRTGRWYLAWPDGERFDSDTYKRAQDAKRALTLLKRDK